jgi:hypothetical protein
MWRYIPHSRYFEGRETLLGWCFGISIKIKRLSFGASWTSGEKPGAKTVVEQNKTLSTQTEETK